jgi:hypothetical protein
VSDKTCLFCSENESVMHMFFCCCVSQNMWSVISEISDLPIITDFESLGRIWLRERGLKYIMF